MSLSHASGTKRPHPETSEAVSGLDLDLQIALAEQALIEREARIRRRTRTISSRVQNSVLRHAGSGVFVAAGTVVLAWLLGRRAPAPAPRRPPSEAEGIARDTGLSLATLLPIVWPLMPRALRARVTPAMASTALAFASPLIARLFGRRRRARPPLKKA
jgi:hypothetical protein